MRSTAVLVKVLSGALVLLSFFLWAMFAFSGSGLVLSLAATSTITAYHFVMRLAVGGLLQWLLGNKVDEERPWFRVRGWESRLYGVLGIRKLKKHLPSYDPSFFDPGKHSFQEILQAGYQAEIVHEIIVVLSFLPLLLDPWLDFLPLLVTSLLAAAFDVCFVLIQRYNRPRYKRVLGRG